MSQSVRFFAGVILFILFVVQPIRANFLSAIALQYRLDPISQSLLLSKAAEIDSCDSNILNALGDSYYDSKNYTMATINYGNAIACSPGNGTMRFKFGEILFLMGFNGIENLSEALQLEPNNPIFRSEYEKFTALQSQYR